MLFLVPSQLPIIVKEHFNQWYSLGAYYLAVTFADIPIQVKFVPKSLVLCFYMIFIVGVSYFALCCNDLFHDISAVRCVPIPAVSSHVHSHFARISKFWYGYRRLNGCQGK